MKLVPVSDLFDVRYGTSLELNALDECVDGVPFVSRTGQNNGVSARVAALSDTPPIPAGVLSVALGGSPLSTFLQDEPFYTGRDVAFLSPRAPMDRNVMLYYATCLQANRYRFSYGRQANRSLASLLVPARAELPTWVGAPPAEKPGSLWDDLRSSRVHLPQASKERLPTTDWKRLSYDDLFTIERGRGPRKCELGDSGRTPFITATNQNNGLSGFTESPPCHMGGTITVNRNGSVGEAYYQEVPFCSTEDVHVFTPKFPLSREAAFFLITLIRREKYRYNYGRKWGIERMKASTMLLPTTVDGFPDTAAMEKVVSSCPSQALLRRIADDAVDGPAK